MCGVGPAGGKAATGRSGALGWLNPHNGGACRGDASSSGIPQRRKKMAMEMEGPLAPWAAGLAGRLEALGYAPSTGTVQMRLAGRLSRFLEKRGLAAGQLSAQVVDEFFADLHAHHGSSWPTPKSLGWLVEDMREGGGAPAPIPAPARSPEEEL